MNSNNNPKRTVYYSSWTTAFVQRVVNAHYFSFGSFLYKPNCVHGVSFALALSLSDSVCVVLPFAAVAVCCFILVCLYFFVVFLWRLKINSVPIGWNAVLYQATANKPFIEWHGASHGKSNKRKSHKQWCAAHSLFSMCFTVYTLDRCWKKSSSSSSSSGAACAGGVAAVAAVITSARLRGKVDTGESECFEFQRSRSASQQNTQ